MSGTPAVAIVGPSAYERWRASRLGAVTEELESKLIFDLMDGLAGRRLLDIGCGDGSLVRLAASRRAEAIGIDPDPAMIAAACSPTAESESTARFLESRAERLPFSDASFDVVVAVTSLCFVPDAATAVGKWRGCSGRAAAW